MILNAITGFAASSKDKRDTLEGFLDDVLADMPDKPVEINKNIVYSSHPGCVEDSIKWLYSVPGNRILLVGKSMGAVRTWWMVFHYWKNLLMRFDAEPAGKLGVFLLDPHGWQQGDGRVGSYGLEIDSMDAKSGWRRGDVNIRCLYQRNDYPKGAFLETEMSGVNIQLGKDADHWNIEKYSTPTGRLVGREIQEMIRWVMK